MKVSIDDICGFEKGYAGVNVALNSVTNGVIVTPFDTVKGIVNFNQQFHHLIYQDCKSIEYHWEKVWFQRD